MAKKKSVGHPKNFATPDLFQKVWNEYKDLVDADPHIEEVLTVKGDIVKVKKPRPYMRQGFEAYCYNNGYGHVCQYIKNQEGLYNEYIPIVTHARNEWEDNQISGTLTGRFKAPNLVARISNLKENIEQTNNIKLDQITGMEVK